MKKAILGTTSLAMLLVYGVVGLVVLAVAAAFIVPPLMDWNGYKADIAEAVKEATGRDITIDGDISVSLLPSPEASVSGIRLSNMDGGTEDTMVALESVDAEIALWPLLSGEIKVESVTLVGPQIVLERTADGQANWVFEPNEVAAASEPADGGDDLDLSLDKFLIENGSIRYIEAGTQVAALVDLNAEMTAQSLSGPFAAAGTAQINGMPFSFDAGVGTLATAPELAVVVKTEAGAGEVNLNGALIDDGFAGTVVLAADDGRAFVSALAAAAGSDFAAPDMLAGGLTVYTELTAGPEAVSAEKLAVTLGESRLSGHARLTMAEIGQSFDVALAGEQLDVDAILAAMGTGGEASDQGDGGFALPGDLTGQVAFEFGSVILQGGTIGDVVLRASLAEGLLTLQQASMTLPGNSPVAVQGSVSGGQSGPAFSGNVEISSGNPRALFDWAQLDASSLPEGAVRSFNFSGSVNADAGSVRLDPFTLSLDDTNATGSLALALAGKPAISVTANVDRFDADLYTGQAGGDTDADAAGGNPLAAFDADVNLNIGSLTLGGNAYGPVNVIAAVQNGGLTIDQLTGGGPGGASFDVSGTVSDPSAPAFDLRFDVSHPNLQLLLGVFGLDAGGAPAVSIAATGVAQSDGANLNISDLRAFLGESDINGTITAALGDPAQLNAQLQSNILNLDALLPGDSGGTGGGGPRWSNEPIDLVALRGVNGTIDWSVGRLVMAPTGLDNAQLHAVLNDGVLSISDLTVSIGGGPLAINAVVDTNVGHAVTLSANGQGLTLEPGVLAFGDVSIDGASIDLTLNVTGTGASMAQLISSLNGTGSLAVNGGVINGLSLGGWRDAINGLGGGLGGSMANLSNLGGILSGGFDQGVLGGATPIGSLTGTFQIVNGEVFTSDLRLSTDVAAVELDGGISLPDWTISSLGSAIVQQLIFENVPAIPFGLGGSLSSPTFEPDFSALQLFMGTDVMGLSLDQLPADILAGLPIQGLTPDMLRGVDPQQFISSLTSGQDSFGPEVFQQLLQGGESGGSLVPQPDALLGQLLGGGLSGDAAAGTDAPEPALSPADELRRLLETSPAAIPENTATTEDILHLDTPEEIGETLESVTESLTPDGASDLPVPGDVLDLLSPDDGGQPVETPTAETPVVETPADDAPVLDSPAEPETLDSPAPDQSPAEPPVEDAETAPEQAAPAEPAADTAEETAVEANETTPEPAVMDQDAAEAADEAPADLTDEAAESAEPAPPAGSQPDAEDAPVEPEAMRQPDALPAEASDTATEPAAAEEPEVLEPAESAAETEPAAEPALEQSGDVVEEAGEAAAEVGDEAVEILEDTGEAINETADEVIDEVDDAVDRAGEALDDLF